MQHAALCPCMLCAELTRQHERSCAPSLLVCLSHVFTRCPPPIHLSRCPLDMESGWTVEDNYFESTSRCMFIGGGRQNTVRSNIFVNCTTPVHVDARGLGWMKCGAPNDVYPAAFTTELETVFRYRQPPWSTAFPGINTTLFPCAPSLNTITDNSFCLSKVDEPDCAQCPVSHAFPYTPSPATGSYCCSIPTVAGACPSKEICCLTPGSQKVTPWGKHGCEGIARCGNNPANHSACQPPSPPGLPPGFSDFEETGGNPAWQNIFSNNTAFKC